MGLTPNAEAAALQIATPKVAMVGPASCYEDLAGAQHAPQTQDLQIRMISARQAHRAAPMTGALVLACAAVIKNSVVAGCIAEGADPLNLRIGTPSGIVTVGTTHNPATGAVGGVRIFRTQRRLMDGHIYVSLPAAPVLPQIRTNEKSYA